MGLKRGCRRRDLRVVRPSGFLEAIALVGAAIREVKLIQVILCAIQCRKPAKAETQALFSRW